MRRKAAWLIVAGICVAFSASTFAQTVTQRFPASGSFVVPPNVTTITIKAWGAGGGGSERSGSTADAGGGGGGGGYAGGNMTVAAGNTITVTIGTGGAGATGSGNNGAAGTSTIVTNGTSTVTAQGGAGGTAVNGGGTGGAGGGAAFAGSVASQVTRTGGAGAGANNGANDGGGGGGGAGDANNGSAGSGTTGGNGGTASGGAGGAGSTDDNPGVNGTTYGGGGGGASDNTASSGGNGANGYVIITYTLSSPNATFYTAALTSGCAGNNVRFTLSSSFFPTDANYTLTYSVSGANTIASTTLNFAFTAGSPGSSVISVPDLNAAGASTLSVSQLTNTSGDFSVTFPPSTLNFNLVLCNTWYSYQTGNYNDFNTWTRDPSGATFDNPANVFPSSGDDITILNGFTVTVNVNNIALGSTTIQGGGILDMAASTGQYLGNITGTGLLRVLGVNLPSGIYTDFVSTLGGTVEYYNTGGNLPTGQTTYNKIIFSNTTASNITYVLVSNLTLNGTMTLTTTGSGTVNWQINDASNNNRTIVLNGDLNVAAGGRINVGTGNEGAATPHSLSLYGNITNNGIIKFYDATDNELPEADYGVIYPIPMGGSDLHRNELQGNAVTVTTLGTTNQTLTCNNTTDFYRLVLNKGSGQIAKLTVNSTNTSYFRLFGPANLGSGSGSAPNQYSDNALAIVNGILELTGSINIPCLNLATGNEYFSIPQNGQMWLNGPNVTVRLSDNNPAHNNTASFRLMLSGTFRVSNGTFHSGVGGGIGSEDGGSYLQSGGTVNTWQFRPRAAGTGIFSFNMSGGTFNVGYGYPVSGGYTNDDYSRFDLTSANSTFQMSGGTLNVAKPTNPNGGEGGLFRVGSSAANYSVIGGTINLYTGVENGTNSYTGHIYSTAPLFDVNIFEESAVSEAANLQLSLVVINNLTIDGTNNPILTSSGSNNVSVAGNFTIANGGTYTPTTAVTTFNGAGAQVWTNNGTITALGSVVMNKSAGTLTLAGTTAPATFPNITTALTLTSGTLADGGKTIVVSGTGVLTNNATHSGAGAIDYQSTASIQGSGGTFGNLTITTNATVGMSGNQTVSGTLRLMGGSTILNIGANSLTALGAIYSDGTTGVAFGSTKMIMTNGFHNAGGLTRQGASGALLFPVGTGSLYTPCSISVTATTHGTITVRPVNSEHPNVSALNQSLKYYWRVTSSGYVGISSPITHSPYDFATSTLLSGTLTAYRSARFDPTALSWAQNSTTYDATGTTVIQSFTNTNLGVAAVIDGEYTVGNATAFVTVQAYYSKGNGSWGAATGVWTASPTHAGADLAGPPCATCPVRIGNGSGINHTITVDANGRSCGTLAINTGSTLDVAYYTSLNFGTNTGGAVTGRGTLRSAGAFPAGDFTNFLGTNGGTVEWYLPIGVLTGTLTGGSSTGLGGMTIGTYNNVASSSGGNGTGARYTVVVTAANTIGTITVTTPGSGYFINDNITFNGSLFGGVGSTTRTIAAGNVINSYAVPDVGPAPQALSLATYYNLIFNPSAGKTIQLPPASMTIYNNWTQQTGSGTVTNNGARAIAVTGNIAITNGTMQLTNSGSTTMSVNGNITVGGGGIFNTNGGTHSITLQGGVTNNGTINFASGGGTVALNFIGTNNVTIGGAGLGNTTLSTVTVNKGSGISASVTLNVGGTVATVPVAGGWLTITNGTFEWASASTSNLSTTSYTINPTARLRVSAGTVNTTNGDNDGYDLFLNGTLQVTGGAVNVGNTTINGNNVDIEYGSAGIPNLQVSGGALWVKSSVRRSSTTITGALAYSQTGGTVTVGGISSSEVSDRGVFEIDANAGSSFALTGTSVLTIQRQASVTSYADFYLNPSSSNVASTSTINLGLSSVSTNTNFKINVAPAVGNLTIAGTNAHTVNMFSNALVVGGTLTIPTGSTLNTNSLNVSIAGDLTCAGTYTGGTNNTIFNGSAAQAGQLSSTSTFNDFTVNKTGNSTLTLSGTSPTLQTLYLLSGTLDVGALNLDIRRNITNNSSQTGAGSLLIFSTTGVSNTITSSNGSFTNLTLGGTAVSKSITVDGSTTINGTLAFPASGSRTFNIGSNQLTFNTAGTVSNASSTRYIKTNGVSSDLGVTKIWNTGTSTFVYQVGSSSYYTPVSYSLNVGTSGSLTVIPVNGPHPTYFQGSGQEILRYYWTVRRGATLVATASGTHTYSYPSSLLTCTSCTGSPLAAYFDGNSNPLGWTTSGHGGTATSTTMTFATTPTTNIPSAGNFYDYSVGTAQTLPNPILPLYSRKGLVATVGNTGVGASWTTASNWTTDTDGDLDLNNPSSLAPTGVPVVILTGSRINILTNGQKAYRSTINGTGVLNNGTTTGHNFGVISGTGTFRTATNTFPAGDYTAFVASTGGTIEYVAPMTMNSRATYNNLSVFSGSTGTVTMTATDLVLNGSLTIPTGVTLSNANNRVITLAGNWNNSGTFSPGTGGVTFNGTLAQTVAGTNSFNNLTISNASGVTLSGTASNNVAGVLTLTTGNIITSATNVLNLGASATVSGGSASSYVSGPMTKVMSIGTSFTAPIGKIAATRYRPVRIDNTSATDTWSFEYFGNNPTSAGYPNLTMNTANILTVSQYEYWMVSRAGSASADLTLSYDVGSYTPSAIDALTNLRVARWESSVPWWDVPPGGGVHSASGNTTAGTVTVTNVTSFSPVTLASIISPSALPIQLLSFDGQVVPMGVQLRWNTVSELNNDRFELEKSLNGEKFSAFATIKGNGTSFEEHNYDYLDTKVAPGRSYYRLKQIDFNGKASYSKVIRVDYNGDFTYTVFPNPATTELNFQILGIEGMSAVNVSIFDELGRKVLAAEAPVDELTASVNGHVLIDKLANGIYFFKVEGTNVYSKVVIQK
ncbi:MAG TPA: T9SS type A sorting domain-containing protein [Cyclobacteriaceae bacterium]|nr:T9SS type A sorting domain-containing protein [Cyclobacteriaceae bacterium]